MLAPDDMYFKEIPKVIIPENDRDSNIGPIIICTTILAIFTTIGLLVYAF